MTMTTSNDSITQMRGSIGRGFNWRLFLEDNITGSWYQTVWVILLTTVTAFYTVGQLGRLPVSTIILLVIWLVGILMVVVGELRHQRSRVSRWLKENLLSSISNTLLTLLVVLVLASAVNGFVQWGIVNASFDPDRTAPEDRPENGATWGVLWGARKLMMTGRLEPEHTWRVWLALGFILAMWLATYVGGRPAFKEKLKHVRTVINGLWLLSPAILFIFLAGVAETPYNVGGLLTGVVLLLAVYVLLWWQKVISFSWVGLVGTAAAWPLLYTIWWAVGTSGIFVPINVDNWGGFMLTLIIASSVIVLSLPLGMVLALARRSEVYGIPPWITWPLAIGATIWGFTTTPELLATSRNAFEQIISFWPVLILVVAYLIQRMFKGNIVAGASTAFIELIRSVPLITLLFMGINMAPFFLEVGASAPAKPWPVIVAYTLFSSAYMAETIRGGLQAIPNGQYEAADSLGFNTLQKMRFIILPQAIRIVIPAIVGQFIGAYKSSSLVSIVGLFEFLGINRLIISNERWFGLRLELYAFMAVVYFLGSFVMSSYSRRLEARLGVGQR
jgi:general L-amino acid transport system permease protein